MLARVGCSAGLGARWSIRWWPRRTDQARAARRLAQASATRRNNRERSGRQRCAQCGSPCTREPRTCGCLQQPARRDSKVKPHVMHPRERPTFDMRGRRERAKPACGCPLDGVVIRRHQRDELDAGALHESWPRARCPQLQALLHPTRLSGGGWCRSESWRTRICSSHRCR